MAPCVRKRNDGLPDNILGIPKVREYKYLGVLIDEQLRFKSELKHKK